jgi:acetate kinase
VKDALILTLNAGSSSIKFGLYGAEPEPVERLRGQIDRLGPQARLVLDGQADEVAAPDHERASPPSSPRSRPVSAPRGSRVSATASSMAAPISTAPERITPILIERLTALAPLAPLHQPHNLAGIRAAVAAFPDAVQVACFDTAFHRGHPSSTTPSPCRAASTTRACAATASTG